MHLRQRAPKCRLYYQKYVPCIDKEFQDKLDKKDAEDRKKLKAIGKSNQYCEFNTIQLSRPRPKFAYEP